MNKLPAQSTPQKTEKRKEGACEKYREAPVLNLSVNNNSQNKEEGEGRRKPPDTTRESFPFPHIYYHHTQRVDYLTRLRERFLSFLHFTAVACVRVSGERSVIKSS